MEDLFIVWDESFATGVPAIDKQHRKIIDKYNEFVMAIANGSGRQVAGEILDFLQFYAAWHFEKEEECMEAYRCPVAAVNKQAHAEFLVRFTEFYDQWQVGVMDHDLVLETFRELGAWIEGHIRRVDAKLSSCVHP